MSMHAKDSHSLISKGYCEISHLMLVTSITKSLLFVYLQRFCITLEMNIMKKKIEIKVHL